MSLFDRVLRVVRAQANHWIEATEDSEAVVEETVGAMQQDLASLRQAVAKAIATQKRAERQAAQAEAAAENWRQRARLALNQGNEAAARAALDRSQMSARTASVWHAQIEQNQAIAAQLRDNLRHQEQQFAEAKLQKEQLVARTQSARATRNMYELRDGVSGGTAMSAFERLEDTAMCLEAEAEIMAARESDRLDRAAAIEAELAAMKVNSVSPEGGEG